MVRQVKAIAPASPLPKRVHTPSRYRCESILRGLSVLLGFPRIAAAHGSQTVSLHGAPAESALVNDVLTTSSRGRARS